MKATRQNPSSSQACLSNMRKEYGDLCELLGNTAEKGRAYKASETMEQTILTAGWDGEWFLRAYDAFW